MTIYRHQRCAGHGTGDGVDAGEVMEDTSLSTGGTLTISDDDAGEADLHGANRTRQAHTARSTSAPMACGRTNNGPGRSSRVA
ncbi:hypothetical protein OH492_25350 [Vibrio chagasii]|nr:hypothetical protein [Vibrio chagasii]